MNNLQIIHEDNDIIVCYKPAGVATDQETGTAGHGKPPKKLQGKKERAGIYRRGSQAGPAGGGHYGFRQK